MKNIKLIVEFEGTKYSGWQKQTNGISVQQKLYEALLRLTGEECEVIGCSRTDAGVHAKRYVCNFKTESTIPGDKFKYAINNILPQDIVVVDSEEVSDSFHARFDARKKRYEYTICNREMPPAIGRQYAYHFSEKLNLDKMRRSAAYLIGKHDFSSFKNSGSSIKTSVRTIYEINISSCDDLIRISIMGDGFLYNMVRIISGTLIEAGIGKIEPEEIEYIIESKDRSSAGKTAPPQGLCLEEVYY